MEKLSIIIPAYNEEKTVRKLVEKVIAVSFPFITSKEIIIINDASRDKTGEIINNLASTYNFVFAYSNKKNLGKSQSVREGILKSTGDVVIIQDADFEYEPAEIADLLTLMNSKNLDVVYGNRFGKNNKVIYIKNYIGNKVLSLLSNFFTYPRIKVWIPDMEVCYKLVKGNIVREIAAKIVSKSRFGLEPEITAKLSRYKSAGKHLKFGIVPISYYPRTLAEGKHLHAFRDGIQALKEILKFNLGSNR